MTTEDLIASLSADPRRHRNPATIGLFAAALLVSAALAIAVSAFVFKPHGAFAVSGVDLLFLKIAFTMAVALAALPVLKQLSTPGAPLHHAPLLVLPFVAIFALAALSAAGHSRGHLWLEISQSAWRACLVEIPLFAIAPFVAMAVLVRRFAPTRLHYTGASLGVLAGGVGGTAYALHCHDTSIAFIAIAYSAAILLTGAIGAIVGGRLLRWS